MTFKSENELKSYLLSKSRVAVQLAVENVYQVIDRFVKEFYVDYSPTMYERTYQLYRSLVKTDVEPTTNGWQAIVYFDFAKLVYTTGASPSGYSVVDAASRGGHGATGLRVVKRSASIWDEPMAILKANKNEILKSRLISAGIPVR